MWTSPENASLIVEQIALLLSEADPENGSVYEQNAAAYQEELDRLDREFRDIVDHAQRKLLIFGDRFPFRYFADAYGLEYYAAFPGAPLTQRPVRLPWRS